LQGQHEVGRLRLLLRLALLEYISTTLGTT
jgi:hypothetical protein